MFRILLIIGAGGFLGSVSRYLLSRYVQQAVLSPFPYGTFWVNIAGCFLIGLFYGLSERSGLMSDDLRLFLTVGFCGGFTTFSTFANENLTFLRDGAFLYFAAYTSLSVFFGLAAVYLGNLATKLF
jgi:CrcB protein